jgi:hypothetical protein
MASFARANNALSTYTCGGVHDKIQHSIPTTNIQISIADLMNVAVDRGACRDATFADASPQLDVTTSR